MTQPEYPKAKYNNSVAGAALTIGVSPETLELFINQMREYEKKTALGENPDSKLVYWWAYVEVYNNMQASAAKAKMLEEQQEYAVKNIETLCKTIDRLVAVGDELAEKLADYEPDSLTTDWTNAKQDWGVDKDKRKLI